MKSKKKWNRAAVGLAVLVLPGLGFTSMASASTASVASGVKAAKAQLNEFSAVPTFTPPNSAFKITSLKGKTLAMVAIDQTTPALEFAIEGAQQAAKVAGLQTSVFDGKDEPSLMIEGIDQAISQHVGAIALVGVPIALISTQLKAAAKAGIPVVNVENNQPSTTAPGQGAGKGIYATASENMKLEAELAADGAVVGTNGKAKAVIMNTPGITPGPPIVQGYRSVLEKCAGCSLVTTTSTEIQDWSTGIGPETTSVLDANPTVNVLLPIFSTMALFATPAVQQAGKAGKVTVFTTSANQPTARLMESSGTILAGAAGHSDFWVGWLTVNQAMRGMLKLKPGNPEVPPRWVTPQTVKKDGTSEADLYGTTYVAAFKKLWIRG